MSTTIAELLPLLLEKTRAKKIPWQLSDSDIEVFVRMGKNMIEIDSYSESGFSDNLSYRICIRDETGKIIDVGTWSLEKIEGSTLWEIFQYARRSALKIDETLDDLRDRLLKL